MKPKQLLFISIAAVILISLVFYLRKQENVKMDKTEKSIGTEIFKDIPINDVTLIQITQKNKNIIKLKKTENGWELESLFSYPADFEKIKNLLTTIVGLKNIQNLKIGEKDQLSRLGLENPGSAEGAGDIFEFFGDNNKKILTFVTGKQHQRKGEKGSDSDISWPDGRFILMPDKAGTVLVDKTLDESGWEPANWLDRSFISDKDIKTALLSIDGEVKWVLSRKKKEDPMTLEKMPEGKELETSKVSAIANCLHSIRFATIADPSMGISETGLDAPSIFTAESFSGKKYEFRIGKVKDNQRYVRVDVSFVPPPQEQEIQVESAKETDKEKKDEKELKETAEKAEKEKKAKEEELKKTENSAKEEQKKYSKWTYLIASSSLEPMLTDINDLFKKPKEEDKNKKPGIKKLDTGTNDEEPEMDSEPEQEN